MNELQARRRRQLGRVLVFLLFTAAVAIRLVGITRPVIQAGVWHEIDVAAIARNYHEEGMNPLYPRIDWRGDGPGYAEMELPILPWSLAVLYNSFGVHEFLGRILSFIVSLLSLYVFFRLARHFLPAVPALAAWTFFAFQPLIVAHSTSLQPEGVMLLFYMGSAYCFLRWLDSGTRFYYVIAIASTALAILAKAPAAHIGIFFALVLFHERGFRFLKDSCVWCFAVAALIAPILWYLHSHHLFTLYGNSLGLSDEYHWAGWDLLTNAYFVNGIARHEISIWTATGLLVVAFGVLLNPSRKVVKYSFYWLVAIFAFYLAAARTTADPWATHYHIVSVLPAALLVGAGVESICTAQISHSLLRRLILVLSVAAIGGAIVGGTAMVGQPSDRVLDASVRTGIGVAFLIALAATAGPLRIGQVHGQRFKVMQTFLTCAATIALASTYVSELKGSRWRVEHNLVPDPLYDCAIQMAPCLTRNGLILASGTNELDRDGYPLAINAPYMFYWLHRKGFSISSESQSLETVRRFAGRGAEYFVAEKRQLASKPGFEAALRAAYKVRGECDDALIFDLRSACQ